MQTAHLSEMLPFGSVSSDPQNHWLPSSFPLNQSRERQKELPGAFAPNRGPSVGASKCLAQTSKMAAVIVELGPPTWMLVPLVLFRESEPCKRVMVLLVAL